MVYIAADGTIQQSRQWGVGSVGGFVWGIVDFVVLFFRTMFNPYLTKDGDRSYSSDYRRPGGRGPPPPPRRGFRGFGTGNSPAPPPVMGGG